MSKENDWQEEVGCYSVEHLDTDFGLWWGHGTVETIEEAETLYDKTMKTRYKPALRIVQIIKINWNGIRKR